MPRAGLDAAIVTERAATILDEIAAHTPAGVTGLSLAAVAESLGVRAPSLYKHVAGLADLEHRVMVRAKDELARTLSASAAGRDRSAALHALARTYREWARSHPGQYPLTTRAPAHDDDADIAASAALAEVIYAVLRGYSLTGDEAVDATRLLRATLHGFVTLEAAGAFALPHSVEESFTNAITAIAEGFERRSRPSR